MKFEWKNWDNGGKVIFVAFCVAAASMLLDWVDIGIASENGFSQGTVLLLGLWIYPILKLFKNQPINRTWGLVCSIGSVVLTVMYLSDQTFSFFGEEIDASGVGAYLYFLASIAFIVGVAINKPVAISEKNG